MIFKAISEGKNEDKLKIYKSGESTQKIELQFHLLWAVRIFDTAVDFHVGPLMKSLKVDYLEYSHYS